MKVRHWVWWLKPSTPALERQKQAELCELKAELCEFKVCLVYIESSRTDRAV